MILLHPLSCLLCLSCEEGRSESNFLQVWPPVGVILNLLLIAIWNYVLFFLGLSSSGDSSLPTLLIKRLTKLFSTLLLIVLWEIVLLSFFFFSNCYKNVILAVKIHLS